jgi:hypothetical protein
VATTTSYLTEMEVEITPEYQRAKTRKVFSTILYTTANADISERVVQRIATLGMIPFPTAIMDGVLEHLGRRNYPLFRLICERVWSQRPK